MSRCTSCDLPLAAADVLVLKHWIGKTGAPEQLWSGRLDRQAVAVCPACDAYSLGSEHEVAAPFYLEGANAFATVHDGDWWNRSGVDSATWPALGRLRVSPAAVAGALEFTTAADRATPRPAADALVACGLAEAGEWDAAVRALAREVPAEFRPEALDAAVGGLVRVLAHLVHGTAGHDTPLGDGYPGMLPPDTIAKLRNLVADYRDVVDIPERDRWRTMDDAGVWRAVVSQVSVVGGVAGAERMLSTLPPDWYGTLLSLSPDERPTAIHARLRKAGVRYVAATAEGCRKTRALDRNLALFHAGGGPKAYITQIAALPASMQVPMVIRDLAFIKNKGARDFLMGLGLLRDAIALDVRVINGLKAMGADIGPAVAADPNQYAQLEQELLDKVCKPMEVDGVVLDRIMFQKYDEIAARRRATALAG